MTSASHANVARLSCKRTIILLYLLRGDPNKWMHVAINAAGQDFVSSKGWLKYIPSDATADLPKFCVEDDVCCAILCQNNRGDVFQRDTHRTTTKFIDYFAF